MDRGSSKYDLMKKSFYQAVLLRGLRQRVESVRPLIPHLMRPSGGWIRAVRQALGLSYREAAARLGVTAQSFNALEKSEVAGTISVRNLERCAEALDCHLVVAFVPKPKPNIPSQCREGIELADYSLRAVAHSMALENQAVDPIVFVNRE